jgi:anti-sigma factor RsiW
VAERGSHARHDRFAIADAVGTVGAGMIPTTIASCPSCGALHADLLAIRAAVRHAWVPSRPRDFLLSLDDSVRLRPGRWRRLLAGVGTSRDVVTRPLALSLTGLGLSGLLLTAIPAGTFGSATSGAAASVTPEVDVAGGPVATIAAQERVAVPGEDDPLAGLSAALLAAGGAMFLLRRAAPRAGGVR